MILLFCQIQTDILSNSYPRQYCIIGLFILKYRNSKIYCWVSFPIVNTLESPYFYSEIKSISQISLKCPLSFEKWWDQVKILILFLYPQFANINKKKIYVCRQTDTDTYTHYPPHTHTFSFALLCTLAIHLQSPPKDGIKNVNTT